MAENINIAGRLHSTATGNVVAGANEIYDDTKGKKQSVVNQETDAALDDRYPKSQTYNKTELNNLITTPNQEYVTVTATNQTTAATDVLPATGAADTTYRVGNWDGTQYDETCYSEYAWNGSAYVHLSTKTQIGEVFDISAYHATGGTLATYDNLNDALNGTNGGVPQSLQKGGMSVKFVLTSDNKYVQCRYMGTETTGNPNPFLDTANWQGVDDEPTAGSDNLVKSGSVANRIDNLATLSLYTGDSAYAGEQINGIAYTQRNVIYSSVANKYKLYQISKGHYYNVIKEGGNSLADSVILAGFLSLDNFVIGGHFDKVIFNSTDEDGTYLFFAYDDGYIACFEASEESTPYAPVFKCTNSVEYVLQQLNDGIASIENKFVSYAIKGTINNIHTFDSGTYQIMIGNVVHNIGNIDIVLYEYKNSSNYHILKPGEFYKAEYNITSLKNYTQTGNYKLAVYEDDIILDVVNGLSAIKFRNASLEELSLFNTNDINSVDSIDGYAYSSSRDIRSGSGFYTYYLYQIEKGKYYQLIKNSQPENVTLLAGHIKQENFHVGGSFDDVLFGGSDANSSKMIFAEENSHIAILKLNSSTSNYVYIKEYKKNSDEIDAILEDIQELKEEDNVDINVPDKIYAVVGDTLQLYYESIFKVCDFNNYDVNVRCDIGDAYPRYYELTPTITNVGEHSIIFTIKTNDGKVLGTKTTVIKVVSAGSAPQSNINVLCIGASLTEGGEWAAELRRRLTSNGGTPAGLNYGNITFVGRRERTRDGSIINVEATGGYSIIKYLQTDTIAYKFFFTSENPAPEGVQSDAVYACYRYSTLVGTFKIVEFNLNHGVGYITCEAVDYSGAITVYSNGVLEKISGNGPATINYPSSSSVGNPFAYDGVIDIQQYADDYCNGKIDVVIFSELLLANLNNSGNPPYTTDFTTFFENLTTFMQYVISSFPAVKFMIGTMELPDKKGGLGYNYGAGIWNPYYGYKVSCFAGNKALKDYINSNNLGNRLFVINWGNELDNINDYIQTNKKVNPRSNVTEIFGHNGWHPSEIGYMQLADSAYRCFVANILNT